MDLSHMMGLWLVGQSIQAGVGVKPGGVGVVYAPNDASRRDADAPRDATNDKGVGVYPFSADQLCLGDVTPRGCDAHGLPKMRGPGALPGSAPMAGVGLVGELEYGPEGLDAFVPRLFSAVNLAAASHAADAQGGTYGAAVNRGRASIGLSDKLQFVDRFDPEGVLGRARVVGFLERDGEVVQVCEDVAVPSFPVMFDPLSEYLRFQVAAQVAGNGYDDLAGVLAKSGRPTHAVVIVGLSASCLQVSGSQAQLESGAVCHSVVYDSAVTSLSAVTDAFAAGESEGVLSGEGVSWLRQVVGG